jgi:hypothetical protein
MILSPVGRLPLLATFVLLGAGGSGDKVQVAWKGQTFDAAAPPAELGESPRSAVAEWAAWSQKAGYRMELDAGARALVLTPEKGKPEGALALVAFAESWFDGLLPAVHPPPAPIAAPGAKPPTAKAPPGSTPGSTPSSTSGAKTAKSTPTAKTPPPKTSDPIPEDPEGAPPVLAPPKGGTKGASGDDKKANGSGTSSPEGPAWGSGSSAADSRTIVFIALANEKDQNSVLAYLGEKHADLKDWSAKAGRDLGFVIENPLAGAYVQDAQGQEEWNPDHEVLNRVVRLLTLSRFGQLPNWLVHAIAWEAEMTKDRSIYVYPYRDEFVSVTEHESWPLELAHEYKDRAKRPMQIEELTRWNRGTWNGSSARQAFGLVHFLAATKKSALPAVLADLRAQWEENNRKPGEDGTWTRDPNWAPAPEVQLAILRARCGENVLAEAGTWLAAQGSSAGRKATSEAGAKTSAKSD